MADEIRAALEGLNVRFVHNPDFADGLSTSLQTGIEALDESVDAALITLGDMPFVTGDAFNQILQAYQANDDVYGVVATANGKRGNPVLWARRFFKDLTSIQGDTGARHLIGANEALIAEVDIGDAATLDFDTPDALKAVGGENET